MSSPFTRQDACIVIAASLGGRAALRELLGAMPRPLPVPVFVAQHMNGDVESHYVELLDREVAHPFAWATSETTAVAGHVYVAPPGRHLLVGPSGSCLLVDSPRVNFVRPSADLLFRSAAVAYGPAVVCVVLTGRLADGCAGAAAVRRAGGIVIAQDPATCEASGMPRAVIDAGLADLVLAPRQIGAVLVDRLTAPCRPIA